MGLILWECLFTIGFNPSSGSKNRAFLAYFKHLQEPQTSVWGFFYVLIFNNLRD